MGYDATWIKGDGQYAVLHPCGGELTVTLLHNAYRSEGGEGV